MNNFEPCPQQLYIGNSPISSQVGSAVVGSYKIFVEHEPKRKHVL